MTVSNWMHPLELRGLNETKSFSQYSCDIFTNYNEIIDFEYKLVICLHSLPSSNDFDMFSDKSDNGPSSNSSGDSIL